MIYAGSTKILPIVNDMMAIFYDMTVYLSHTYKAVNIKLSQKGA